MDDFLYLKEILSDRARELIAPCPNCKQEMSGTGRMFKEKPPIGGWAVEYFCLNCHENCVLGYFSENQSQVLEIIETLGEEW